MGTGIPCPACGSDEAGVIDGRPTRGAFRRRRQCGCGARYTTYEMVDENQPRERFELRAKLAAMSDEEVAATLRMLAHVDMLIKVREGPKTGPSFQRIARHRPDVVAGSSPFNIGVGDKADGT